MIRFYVFFFFKQKTAYEMRISYWSSDVCSSDLTILTAGPPVEIDRPRRAARVADEQEARAAPEEIPAPADARVAIEIDHQVDDPVVAILVLRAAIAGNARAVGADVRDDVPDDLVEAALEAGEHPVVEGPRSIFTAAMLAEVGLGCKKPAEVEIGRAHD